MDYKSSAVRGLKPARPTAPRLTVDKNNHEGAVKCLAWSCDGHHLATGGDDKNVKIWQFKQNAASPFTLIKVDGSTILQSTDVRDSNSEDQQSSSSTTATASVTALAFSPRHPDILAVASHVDGWNPANHGVTGDLSGVEVVHGSGSRVGRNASPAEELKKAPAQRPRVTIWNIRTRRPISTILLAHNPVSMTFHPSAYQLIIVCMDKTAVDYGVICWQEETSVSAEAINESYGSPLDREVRPTDTTDPTTNFLKDDTAVDPAEKRKRKDDVDSRLAHQKRAETEGDEGWTLRRDIKLVLKERSEEMRGRGFDSGVSELNGACFSPCGTRLYTGNHDGTVHLWHYPTVPTAGSSTRSPSPTRTSEDLSGKDMPPPQAIPMNGEDQDMVGRSEEDVGAVAEESDMVAGEGITSQQPGLTDQTGPDDGTGKLQDSSVPVENGDSDPLAVTPLAWLKCIETNQGCVNCIEMDPRRRFFVTGGSEGLVTACDLANGGPFMTFSSFTEEIKAARLSWNGEYLAIAGTDRAIDIVGTGDNSLIRRVETDGRAVQAMQWSPARLVLAWAPVGATGKWYSIQI